MSRYEKNLITTVFDLNGQTYKLAVNNGPNHLHGGETYKAINKYIFQVDEL